MGCKKNIVLIRHANSIGNKNGIIQGHLDYSLSDRGKEEAISLGEYFKKNNIIFDKVYSSDLARAFETAILSSGFNKKNIILSKDLREIYLGSWQGKKKSEIFTNEIRMTWEKSPSKVNIKDAETLKDAGKRMMRFLKTISGENIAVFSHGGIIAIFLSIIKGTDIDDCWKFRHENTAYSFLEKEDQNIKITKYNIHSHLKTADDSWF
ncbi:MAG: hypothetical protein C0601_04740 [Candidatus Muiribacterium halophilum]|uniref:Histidine phosphatase family protein n=1 Tax=Muiribacterium halophilum TaxID=2053465 RepID=A0A2N5ZI10_MUIH1|nr:MAG: hypothetical protein C0601_04740 [Candidatus Muirbacterium halophilum]